MTTTFDNLTAWRDSLATWRRTLATELLSLPLHLTTDGERTTQRNLTLSISVIDRGLDVLTDTGSTLATLRLGELMGAAEWCGPLPEIEKRIREAPPRPRITDTDIIRTLEMEGDQWVDDFKTGRMTRVDAERRVAVHRKNERAWAMRRP